VTKQYTITKRIAKHGRQAVVVIPALLQGDLRPGTVVKIRFDVLKEAGHD
jgi:hypothetical protein